ncbi:response regulator [Geomonas oryzisoli]|uniref:Response regulator n=1 Tax=Geomonas oryzisoli TaxID=2847992 RepID=A0ABX8J5Y2_9BACT|nr:HD domain-containing phosphohydrolase [Geomonas oryzisoli]QWV92984.1 response regulator [Geomonas oryzisoli]
MDIQSQSEPHKVLLVDDEENITRSIARLLMEQDLGLEVLRAVSGAEGLEQLKAHPDVALILSDQRMPGMSGAQFLEQARTLAPEAVRMVLTGYADMAATMDAINKGGASRYLLKPWDDEVLVRTIREGVEQYRLVQENRRLTALVEQQNRELSAWNDNLKSRVLEQTATIRRQNEELKERNRRVTDSFHETILAFSRLIELHSSRLQEHTRNVTELCVRIARDLKLSPAEVETVRTAALLHDVGVIGISQDILAKRMSAMNREELGIFLQHAIRGQATLDAVEELREAGVLIRHHHERYDGSGFPDGLTGSGIPLGARIIAMADFVDRELTELGGDDPLAALFARMEKELGRGLDPEIFPVVEQHVRALYLPTYSRRAEVAEKELRPKQLLEGMTATRDLHTASGALILERGTVLDAGRIMAVARAYQVDPPSGGIFVSWAPSGTSEGSAARFTASVPVAEQEVAPNRLVEGMKLTRNLYSGTGLLLLTEGTVLNGGVIDAVLRYYRIDPPSCGVWVVEEKRK